MARLSRLSIAIFGALGVLFANSSVAHTSKDYALMAQDTWSAFECSSLASMVGNLKEQERLFLFGYKQGKIFTAALKAKKVRNEDLRREVPLIMFMLLEGPSAEFMLGRVFQFAQHSALEDVFKTGEHYNDKDTQKRKAEQKFWKLNCELIGK